MVEIMSAGYGVGARWNDVTEKIREQVKKGQLHFYAENDDYGPDPYPHVKKILCVVYRRDGGYPKVKTAEENENSYVLSLDD
jgi:hypothetical protein